MKSWRPLKKMGILNLYAIGYPQVEDEYLTKNSASSMRISDSHLVGTFTTAATKFDRWYDMWSGWKKSSASLRGTAGRVQRGLKRGTFHR